MSPSTLEPLEAGHSGMTGGSSGDRARTVRIVMLGLVVLGFALYAFNVGNPLFWDDDDWIVNDPAVHELSWENVRFLFTHDILAGIGQSSNYYRPVLSLSFALNWALGADAPFGYHLVSDGLHVASAVLLFLLLSVLLPNAFRYLSFDIRHSKAAAALAALFWLIHPLNTEAVTYISGRGDPLSLFLMLAALCLWFIGSGRWHGFRPARPWLWRTGAIVAAVLAILSRETAVLLPGYLMLSLMSFVYVQERLWPAFGKALKEAWPFLLISGTYGLLRLTVLNFNDTLNWHRTASIYSEQVAVRTWTFLGALWVYARLVLVPLGLHMERDVPVLASPFIWPVPLVAVLLGLLSWQVIRAWRKGDRIWFFGVGWFFLAMSMASGIAVPINARIYEHWMYVPLIGVVVILARYAVRVYDLFRSRSRILWTLFLSLVICYLLFFAVQTVRRNVIWGDTERFYLQVLDYEPDNVRVLNNLANFYADQKRTEEAEELWTRAIQADPTQPAPYHNLANLARDRGDLQKAEELYLTAIEKQDTFPYAYRNLSAVYLVQKRYQEALDLLLVLEQLTPQDVGAHYAVAQLYLSAGRPDLAREALERGVPYLRQLEAIQAYEELFRTLDGN